MGVVARQAEPPPVLFYLFVGGQAPERRPADGVTEPVPAMPEQAVVDPVGHHDEAHAPVHPPAPERVTVHR